VRQRGATGDRDLSPVFAAKSIAVVSAGKRTTFSGGAIMQMLRQAGYGGRVVPVNGRRPGRPARAGGLPPSRAGMALVN